MPYLGNTPEQQAFTPAVDYFSGNGSTTAFTLSRPVASTAQIQVTVENVPQAPGTAYTVSGNTITFDGAPPSGINNIYVYYTSPITTVIQPGQGTVGTAQIQNGAVIPADLSTGGPSWDTSGNVGIGTSSPSSPLHIFAGASQNQLRLQPIGSTAYYQFGRDGTNGFLYIYGSQAGANGYVFTGADGERMRIDSSGNVGIGTSTPTTAGGRLTVAGTGVYTVSAWNPTSVAANVGSTFYLHGGVDANNLGYVGAYFAGNATTDGGYLTLGTRDVGGTTSEKVRVTAAGLLQFNSGYGSVATAYGCRAWVNFNGTGTPAIRASGNVSSITKNQTGDYTVNFTTAMPDANYCTTAVNGGGNTIDITKVFNPGTPQTASLVRLISLTNAFGLADSNYMYVAIFR